MCNLVKRRWIPWILLSVWIGSVNWGIPGTLLVHAEPLDPDPEPPKCEPPWRTFESIKCFKSTGPLNLSDAEESCKSEAGTLAKIESIEQNTYIRRILLTLDPTWIGVTKLGQNDKALLWSDGTEIGYNNFRMDRPTCSFPCCGVTTSYDGEWAFAPCSSTHHFVCEKSLNNHKLAKSQEDDHEEIQDGVVSPQQPGEEFTPNTSPSEENHPKSPPNSKMITETRDDPSGTPASFHPSSLVISIILTGALGCIIAHLTGFHL